MKIYNSTKIPNGLGYEVDYDAIYQSGYTAGYQSGYTDAIKDCFMITPESVFFGVSGGTREVELTANGDWFISGYTGRFSISPMSGTGSQTITITADTGDECRCRTEDFIRENVSIINKNEREISLEISQGAPSNFLGGFIMNLLWVSGGTAEEIPHGGFPYIHFPSTGGSYAFEFWYRNKELATRSDFYITAPYSNITVEDAHGEAGVWVVIVEVEGFKDEEWDGNRPGSRSLRVQFNYCHDCYSTLGNSFSVNVEQIPRPELHVDTDLPTYYENPNVPATGGTYTFTVNSTMDWTGNTVNLTTGAYNITLSQNSGESGTTIVTATIPENTDNHENNFIIEFGIPNATQHGDIPVYASFYVIQATGEETPTVK